LKIDLTFQFYKIHWSVQRRIKYCSLGVHQRLLIATAMPIVDPLPSRGMITPVPCAKSGQPRRVAEARQ